MPSMRENLISVGAIANTKTLVVFSNSHYWILVKHTHSNIIAIGYQDPTNGIYIVLKDLFKLVLLNLMTWKLYASIFWSLELLKFQISLQEQLHTKFAFHLTRAQNL